MGADQTEIKDLQAEIAETRAKLVADVQGLVDDMNPKNVAKRAVDDAKTFVTAEFENVKQQVKTETGDWRVDKLVVVGGAVLGALTFVLTIRALVNRSRRRSIAAQARRAIEN